MKLGHDKSEKLSLKQAVLIACLIIPCSLLIFSWIFFQYSVTQNPILEERLALTLLGLGILCGCLVFLTFLYFRIHAKVKKHESAMRHIERLLETIHNEAELPEDAASFLQTDDLHHGEVLEEALSKLIEYYQNCGLVSHATRSLYGKISSGDLFTRIDTRRYASKYIQIPMTLNSILSFYDRILDEIPIGISIVDETLRVRYLNKTMRIACGVRRKDIIQGLFISDIGSIRHTEVSENISQVLEHKKALRKEMNINVGSRDYWVNVTTIPRVDKVTGKNMVMQIITEQTELYDLKKNADSANVAKSRFLSSMSHEIRTPINAILGYAQLLQESITLSKSERSFVDTIRKSGNHLLTIINDVLEISKIEEGKIEFHFDSFNLRTLVQDCISMFRPKIEEKGLDLTLNLHDDLPYYIKSDQGKIRQILLNVFSNSVKFTESGRISIEVSAIDFSPAQNSAKIRIDVLDTGYGIDPNDFKKVFDSFKQTASGRKSAGGTGLGMPISRSFARHLGGDLSIVRSEIGKGTTFRIEFRVDIVEHTDLPAEESHDNRQIIGINGKFRVLVVDDNVENRSVIGLFLGKVGIDTIYAQDGGEAIRKAQSYKPDLIFMDLTMPVIDGFDATRYIKDSEWGEKIYVIAVTANVLDETVKKVKEYGFADYIIKPFIKQQIFDVIQKFCDIEYVYETVALGDDKAQIIIDPDKLPEGFTETIRKAVFNGDFDKVGKAIDSLDDEFWDAKQFMLELAENFDGKSLCNLLKTNAD